MPNNLVRRALELIDLEMFRKGWWMLLAIMGTIAALFAVCAVFVARHAAG